MFVDVFVSVFVGVVVSVFVGVTFIPLPIPQAFDFENVLLVFIT